MKTKNGHDGMIDPIQALRRLGDALAGPTPDEEESRRLCAELGIDVDAMFARVMAKVREGHDAEEGPPVSGRRRVAAARAAPSAEGERAAARAAVRVRRKRRP